MYIVFIDESGKPVKKEPQPFVVASVIIHENILDSLEEELLDLKLNFFGRKAYNVEIHGKEVVHGKGYFSQVDMEKREKFLSECYKFIGSKTLTLIASVVLKEKFAGLSEKEARESMERIAYMHLLERVTIYFDKIGSSERILLVVDETDVKHDISIKNRISEEIRMGLYTSRRFSSRRIFPAPLFLPSKEQAGLQLADLVAYAVFKKYSGNLRSAIFDFNKYLVMIWDRFDRCRGGRVEGCGIKVW